MPGRNAHYACLQYLFEGAGDDDFFGSMDTDWSGDYWNYFLFESVGLTLTDSNKRVNPGLLYKLSILYNPLNRVKPLTP